MSELAITYVRTSSVLMEFFGDNGEPTARLLTDPWFSMVMRIVPVFRKPGISLEDMPRLDAIVASHLHPDHFERRSVEELVHPELEIAGCPGIAEHCDGIGVKVHDVAPWATAQIGPFSLTGTPAVHTGPPPLEVNFLIDAGPFRVFFGGDARWSDAYREIADRLDRPIDVALLPIGGTLIFGHRTTMGPLDAVKACNYLRPRYAVPIHEGGEWMPMPPASWHPGRNHHFVDGLKRSTIPVEPCVVAPGQTAIFSEDGSVRHEWRYQTPR